MSAPGSSGSPTTTGSPSGPVAAGPKPNAGGSAQAVPGLRVFIIGEGSETSSCDVYRGRMFLGPLSRIGVDVRYALPSIRVDGKIEPDEFERQTAARVDSLAAAVERADVVVFRRSYVTHILCIECGFATLDTGAATAHVRATSHTVNVPPELAVRRLFGRLETDPDVARRLAIVYETDDDMTHIDPTNGQERLFRHERDLVERMIRRADLVTTSTPNLAGRLAPLATEVRVVRNAVDPAWYGGRPGAAADGIDDHGPHPRVVYYGSMGRLRDYAVCAPAVDAIARAGARRIWFGAPGAASMVAGVAQMFDEIHPYVVGVPAFAQYLTGLRPAIGLAPLVGSRFARAKSELHWLEYSMAGAATVATSMSGGGPYDVIRHGLDGFLAGSRAEWRWALERLAGSSGLRAEVAERARARVIADYDVDSRAIEWAGAYRWAAEHAGRGLDRGRTKIPPAGRVTPISSDRAGADSNRTARRLHASAAPTAAGPGESGGCASSEQPGTPSAAAIFAAYVAAQAFAHRSPLRLLLGADGSANEASAGRPAAEGWITIDTAGEPDVRHDVMFGLPFGDGSVEAIEACHVLEGRGELVAVLAREAARVLRLGGTLRILTADQAAALASQRTLGAEGVILVGRAARLPDFKADTLGRLLRESGFAGPFVQQGSDGELVLEAIR